MVRVRAPAKLNLGLRVLARRHDGYHEIETVFLPLTLFDELSLEETGGGAVTLECDDPGLPAGGENLAVRAAVAAREALGVERGLHLTLSKEIPVGAGLGGGSSDAAAALLGVEALAGRTLAPERRRALALGLGADVPFFLDPRPMLGRGVGEQLTPVPGAPELWWVLVLMPFQVSTADAFRLASAELTLPRGRSSIAALLGSGGVENPPQNDLEQVASRRHPEIGEAREALRRVGARFTSMSGSGPTVYGEFPDRAAAEVAAAEVRLPRGARARVVSSPASDASSWGWGVAKR